MSLRRLRVLVRNLPLDSALVRDTDPSPPWTISDILLAHVWQACAQSSATHPMLDAEMKRVNAASKPDPARARVLAEARQRAKARREAIDAGLIT